MRVLGLAMNPPTFYRAQLLVLSRGNGALRRSQNGLAPLSVPFRPAAPNDGGPVIWPAAKIRGMTSAAIITQFFRST